MSIKIQLLPDCCEYHDQQCNELQSIRKMRWLSLLCDITTLVAGIAFLIWAIHAY